MATKTDTFLIHCLGRRDTRRCQRRFMGVLFLVGLGATSGGRGCGDGMLRVDNLVVHGSWFMACGWWLLVIKLRTTNYEPSCLQLGWLLVTWGWSLVSSSKSEGGLFGGDDE